MKYLHGEIAIFKFSIYKYIYVLYCMAFQDMYKEDPRIWNSIMYKVASAFQQLEQNGIELEGNGLVYPIILGIKGDWSFLVSGLLIWYIAFQFSF